MRRLRARLLVLGGISCLPSCADKAGTGPTSPAVADAATAEPDPIAQPAVRDPPSAEVATPEPEPGDRRSPPPPEPPVLQAPDGTKIEPCEDAPSGMACIAGGPFIRGADDGPANTRPAETVWLQTFYMDVHEVTYKAYKDCQKAKACNRAGPLYNDFSADRQPITGVDWYDAVKFCQVQGKHLPTEAQWEKAARGPDGATHPWGNEPADCERAVIMDAKGRSCGVKKRKEHPDKGKVFEVGSRPAGVYGLYDMSGNAWEWVADWGSKSWTACGDACRGTDPLGPCAGKQPCRGHKEKIVRGGSWYWDASYATSTYRRPHFPENEPFHHFGFRCAASIDEARALRAAPAPADP